MDRGPLKYKSSSGQGCCILLCLGIFRRDFGVDKKECGVLGVFSDRESLHTLAGGVNFFEWSEAHFSKKEAALD